MFAKRLIDGKDLTPPLLLPSSSSYCYKMWTPPKVDSFYNGVVIAHHNFFANELDLQDFARVIISESCQESTGGR